MTEHLKYLGLADTLAAAIPEGRSKIEARETWSFDRSTVLNASEAAACIRWNWFAKRNPEQAFTPNGYARRGSHAESYMIESLEAAGYMFVDTLDDQVSIQDDDGKLSASPDGFLVGKDGEIWTEAIYVELKTIDPRTNRGNLPRERHVKQVELGMEIAGVALLSARGKDAEIPIAGGVILYMDASNYDDVVGHGVPRNPDVLSWAEARHKKVFGARKLTSLDREGKASGECKTCPFSAECLGEDAPAKDATPTVSRANRGSQLEDLTSIYYDLDVQTKTIAEQKAALKEQILEEMRKRNAPSLDVGDYTVTLSKRAGSISVDWRKAEADGIDLSAYKKTGAASEALSVKRRA